MRDCERCGQEVSWTNDTVMLPGDIAAHVCNACRRAHTLMIKQTSLADRSADIEARERHYRSLAAAQQPVSEGEWRALIREQQELSLELAESSVAWLADKAERPVKQMT